MKRGSSSLKRKRSSSPTFSMVDTPGRHVAATVIQRGWKHIICPITLMFIARQDRFRKLLGPQRFSARALCVHVESGRSRDQLTATTIARTFRIAGIPLPPHVIHVDSILDPIVDIIIGDELCDSHICAMTDPIYAFFSRYGLRYGEALVNLVEGSLWHRSRHWGRRRLGRRLRRLLDVVFILDSTIESFRNIAAAHSGLRQGAPT